MIIGHYLSGFISLQVDKAHKVSVKDSSRSENKDIFNIFVLKIVIPFR